LLLNPVVVTQKGGLSMEAIEEKKCKQITKAFCIIKYA